MEAVKLKKKFTILEASHGICETEEKFSILEAPHESSFEFNWEKTRF